MRRSAARPVTLRQGAARYAGAMMRALIALALGAVASSLGGCAIVAVADAGVGLAATTVKTTAKVAGAGVGLAVDGVGAAGRAVTGGGRR